MDEDKNDDSVQPLIKPEEVEISPNMSDHGVDDTDCDTNKKLQSSNSEIVNGNLQHNSQSEPDVPKIEKENNNEMNDGEACGKLMDDQQLDISGDRNENSENGIQSSLPNSENILLDNGEMCYNDRIPSPAQTEITDELDVPNNRDKDTVEADSVNIPNVLKDDTAATESENSLSESAEESRAVSEQTYDIDHMRENDKLEKVKEEQSSVFYDVSLSMENDLTASSSTMNSDVSCDVLSSLPETVSSEISSQNASPTHSIESSSTNASKDSPEHTLHSNKIPDKILDLDPNDSSDMLLSELDAALNEEIKEPEHMELNLCIEAPNGVKQKINLCDIPEYKVMRTNYEALVKQVEVLKTDNTRLTAESKQLESRICTVEKQRDDAEQQVKQIEGQSADDIYMAQIKKMEELIKKQEVELTQTKEKLASHDSAAKRAIASLQNDMKHQTERMRKIHDDAKREKEMMTMKYAQAEQKNIELMQRQGRIELQMKEMVKERETVINRFKALKAEKLKMQETYEARAAELSALNKEVEKQKDNVQSADMKVKWHQNKLKIEAEAHKETKAKVEEYQRKLQVAKEETEQIRRDCQAMVKQYQESDEFRSNSLDKELKEKEQSLQQHLQEKNDQEEVHQVVKRELETLKIRHKDAIAELKTLRDKVTCLEAERITQEHTLDKFRGTLQGQKKDNKDLHDKIARLDFLEKENSMNLEKIKSLENKVEELELTNKDLDIDMEGCSKRESEHLQFSQKVSDKNATLQSENNSLNNKVTGMTAENERLESLCTELQKSVEKLESTLKEEQTKRLTDVDDLSTRLERKTKAVEELTRAVEEEKDEIRTLKRKHMANIKDLTRQLQQARKKLEGQDQGRNPGDCLSVGSRTSSNGSLDTLGNSNPTTVYNSRSSSHEAPPQDDTSPPIVQVVEIDKQMLMEKIVRLQKAHARKNEKLEFMEDHINQLITELQKKTKIIQSYIMREETGVLASESMDRNKAQLAKKGGIMASLYNSHAQDGGMNLDLSLEINHKLQSVLEDTLLKNITLKENIDTLGQEIARISQENRQIQLNLQKQIASKS